MVKDSIAWTLVLVLSCAFCIYTAIDAKLDWIAFGQQYERTQRQFAEVLNQIAQRLDAVEKKQKEQ